MNKPLRLGVLASGRGSNLKAILSEIDAGRLNAEVVLVISDNPKAPALEIAGQRGISTKAAERKSFTNSENLESWMAEELRQAKIELVILAGFMRLLHKKFINDFSGRIINIHPSLLPSFPGLEAQKQALDYGVKISGCTVHFVDEVMDGGRIIAQAAVKVHPGDTEQSLSTRILKEEHRLLPTVIQQLSDAL